MQLVYLWVAEYKNIKNQGFNFSPDFECKYDEKSNKLTIEPKKHTRIFPNNINVTAIVGENGSGKSSLLELLIDTKYIFLKNFIKIIKIKEIVFIYTNIKNLSIPKDKKFKLCKIENIPPKVSPPKICSDNYFIYENSIYPKEKGLFSTLKIDKIKNILYYIQRKESYQKEFGSYFNPDTIEIIANRNINYNNQLLSKIQGSLNNLAKSLKSTKKIFTYKIYYYMLNKMTKESINSVSFVDVNKLEDMREQINDFLIKNINNDKNKELLKQLKKLLQYIEYITEIDDFDKYVEYSGNEYTYSFRVNELFIIKHFFILKNLPECFQEDFIDTIKDMKYSDLSSGEKSILNIIFYVERIIQNNVSEKYVFLLDEPDNELHPNWQKKLLHYLIEIFKNRKQNIHFILTTHSPFLLSDLPKENIIFLKNGKQTYPDIETFGANIHTLLSHGFFMKDGLMGEFAKSQIDDVIKLLNNLKKLTDDKIQHCEYIISIVGEPILKRQMQKMLDSKRLKKIDDINQKILDMEYELNILKENQSKFVQDELKDRGKKKYTQRNDDDKN